MISTQKTNIYFQNIFAINDYIINLAMSLRTVLHALHLLIHYGMQRMSNLEQNVYGAMVAHVQIIRTSNVHHKAGS